MPATPEIPYERELRQELVEAISHRRRGMWGSSTVVAFTAAAAMVAAAGIMFVSTRQEQPAPREEQSSSSMNAPVLQGENPLGYGGRVSLEEAMRQTPYKLAVPPTESDTGARKGVWIGGGGCEARQCSGPQVGFVWATGLEFYVDEVDPSDLTEDQAIASWRKKAQKEKEAQILTVRGHTAIGHDQVQGISNLTWMERSLTLSFVSPNHTLDQLQRFAVAVKYEE